MEIKKFLEKVDEKYKGKFLGCTGDDAYMTFTFLVKKEKVNLMIPTRDSEEEAMAKIDELYSKENIWDME